MVKETTAIMVIFVVVIIVAGGLIWELAPSFLDKIAEWIDEGFETAFQGDAEGLSTMGLKIQYADGTERDFKTKEFSLLPLTIMDDGGEVILVIPYVSTTVEHTFDTVSSWEYELTDFDALVVNVDSGESAYILENEQRLMTYSIPWVSGATEEIALTSWSGGELASWLSGYPEFEIGTYQMQMTADVRVLLTATDGATSEETGSNSAIWTFQWTGEGAEGITSLSVVVATSVTQ